ncbi:hypothetical protein HDU96_001594 [Phlyctochytrium bullatum]|nr:hypothetical protein HDU96_001594 [Phlyctochytrium bullatum]
MLSTRGRGGKHRNRRSNAPFSRHPLPPRPVAPAIPVAAEEEDLVYIDAFGQPRYRDYFAGSGGLGQIIEDVQQAQVPYLAFADVDKRLDGRNKTEILVNRALGEGKATQAYFDFIERQEAKRLQAARAQASTSARKHGKDKKKGKKKNTKRPRGTRGGRNRSRQGSNASPASDDDVEASDDDRVDEALDEDVDFDDVPPPPPPPPQARGPVAATQPSQVRAQPRHESNAAATSRPRNEPRGKQVGAAPSAKSPSAASDISTLLRSARPIKKRPDDGVLCDKEDFVRELRKLQLHLETLFPGELDLDDRVCDYKFTWQPDRVWEAYVHTYEVFDELRPRFLERCQLVREFVRHYEDWFAERGYYVHEKYVIPDDEALSEFSVQALYALCYQYHLLWDTEAQRPFTIKDWSRSLLWDNEKLKAHKAGEKRDPMQGVEQGSSTRSPGIGESLLDRADLPSLEHLRSRK